MLRENVHKVGINALAQVGGHTFYVGGIKVPLKTLAGTKNVQKRLGGQNLTLENHTIEPINA